MCESGVVVEPLASVLDVFLPLYVFFHSGLGDLGGGGAFFVRVSALCVEQTMGVCIGSHFLASPLPLSMGRGVGLCVWGKKGGIS